MKRMNNNRLVQHQFRLTVIAAMLALSATSQASAGQLVLSAVPLFATTGAKANVMLTLDNSNSMDEDASGAPAPCDTGGCGSTADSSKSQIARTVAQNLIATYTNKINMGLMAYQQAAMSAWYVHTSPYDVSYNPANYDPAWTGARESATHKRFRDPNPTSAGNYIYYNVRLPYYNTSNQGNGFCYTNTAIPFKNGLPYPADPTVGPWDTYRCFTSKTGGSDTLPTPFGNTTAEAAAGYSGFFSQVAFSSSDSDYAQQIIDFGNQNTYTPVGPTWFSNSSPGKGYVHVPIALLDSTQAGKLNMKLGRSQFVSNRPTGAAYPLQNAGLTPMEGTLETAKNYFAGSLTAASEGGSLSAPPTSCGKNFNVYLTDGLPSTSKSGAVVADATTAIAAVATSAAALKTAGVSTYVIGFALPYGTDPTTLNTIAAAGGTDTAYSASDLTSLNTTMSNIFSDILARTGSAAAVATNATALSTTSAIFQARFDSSDWSGQLLKYALDPNTGVPNSTPTWLAGSADVSSPPAYYVPLPTFGSRAILTYKPSAAAGAAGIPFRWPVSPATPTATELDVAQTTALGSAAALNYLRGDGSNEGTGASNYRVRTNGKLGDIVNSSPVYVGAPVAGYPASFEGGTYATFVNSKSGRTPMVYVGGNDGMLHGFNATTGAEVFAYVPNVALPNLSQLTSKTYAHRYFVDGSPTVGDVRIGTTWKTILLGGMNGGGQGIYALDITDPTNFTEATASSVVKWEFTDKDNIATTGITDGDQDLGMTFSQPAIAKMHNGRWAAIFGNGYNNSNTIGDSSASTTGTAFLYIVDIDTGHLLAKIDTKAGSAATPNGLASPASVDIDGDDVADFIYAGDLQGNMWKFDVTSATASSWGVAYGTSAAPRPLYTATDSAGTPLVQPITTKPEVSQHKTLADTYMVYFGTGKYIETGDNGTTGMQTQTFYGIMDNGTQNNLSRSDLLQQKILEECAATTPGSSHVTCDTSRSAAWRLSTDATLTYCDASKSPLVAGCKYGWYMDLYNTQGGTSTANLGEKQVSNPIFRFGRIIFTTLVPSAASCSGGGDSWLMELDAFDGSQLDTTPFDINGDRVFSNADFMTGSATSTNTTVRAVVGKKISGIVGTPTIVATKTNEGKNMSTSTGGLANVSESTGSIGRISWRELRE